jgi:multiple sugar transport system permease protein
MATRTQSKTTPIEVKAPARRLSLARRRNMTGYIFISPFILGFLIWFLIPALVAVFLTVHEWNLITAPEYVGLDNIERLLSDPLLPQSLKATFIYTAVSVPIGLLLSFLLALLVNNNLPGISIFRTVFYLPSIIPAVANAALWAWIFNTEFGLMNVLVRGMGGSKIPWLQDPAWAQPALIIMSLWGIGGSMIIFLAGLQGIPDIYYEAAEIDGAGRWTRLWHITLPLMSPIIFFNLVIGFIRLSDYTGRSTKRYPLPCAIHLPDGVPEPERRLCGGAVIPPVLYVDGPVVPGVSVHREPYLLRKPR